jgi:type VI secretion system protein ImpM
VDEAPAWYGKISSLGDFAHRRMSPQLRELCDEWLSRAVTDSRDRLGASWLDTYLTAPLWRFAWAPGIVDERWWFGVLMPSCDNVGRYFPLIVLEPLDPPPADATALDHLERWYDHLARAALQTLHEQASPDAFDGVLRDAPPWPPANGERRASSLRAGMEALVVQQMVNRLAGHSIWWRGAEAPDLLLTLPALPQGDEFLALLRGD